MAPCLLHTLPCPQEYGGNLPPPSLGPGWLADQVFGVPPQSRAQVGFPHIPLHPRHTPFRYLLQL